MKYGSYGFLIEERVKTEFGWSDWSLPFGLDDAPFDSAAAARKEARSRAKKDFQYRVRKYVRVERGR